LFLEENASRLFIILGIASEKITKLKRGSKRINKKFDITDGNLYIHSCTEKEKNMPALKHPKKKRTCPL